MGAGGVYRYARRIGRRRHRGYARCVGRFVAGGKNRSGKKSGTRAVRTINRAVKTILKGRLKSCFRRPLLKSSCKTALLKLHAERHIDFLPLRAFVGERVADKRVLLQPVPADAQHEAFRGGAG